MKHIKKYRYEILIFLVEAVCMMLELVASRVLSPHFGSSNVVWTSVIAMILLGSSVGNYLGGKVADKREIEKNLAFILGVVAIFLVIIANNAYNIVFFISSLIENVKAGAMVSTAIIFLIPAILLGMMPPIILKLKLVNIDDAGKTSGRINAISTIGGIAGTVAGGFWLIPIIGSIQIIYVLAGIMAMLLFLVEIKKGIKAKIIISLFAVVCLMMSFISYNGNASQEEKVLRGDIGANISFDTEYSKIEIYNTMVESGDKVRIFSSDGGYETIMRLDEDNKYEPWAKYIKMYDLIFKSKKEIKNVLMIGGAGYSYPKYYISKYLDKNMDVVEIDPEVTQIAKKYFRLDELMNEEELNAKERLKLISDDGRIYLNKTQKRYDSILNDAFTGRIPPKSLVTIEAVQIIKNALTEKGIYSINIIGALEGKYSRFLRAEVNTIKQVFKNVYVIPCKMEEFNPNEAENHIIIATDQELNFDWKYDLSLDDEIILTDDYCPVDILTDYDTF